MELQYDIEEQIWRSQALCAANGGNITALFYAEDREGIELAKSICAACPVRAECLETALANREPYGVWGGERFSKGRIHQPRPSGRPRKKPAPLDHPEAAPVLVDA